MEKYDHKKIEDKWQKYWAKHSELNAADNDSANSKYYCLDMFPYPSGDGLHAGHVESYTATDIMSRYMRLKGKNVLHPQGWDAFGLPAENFAIKTKVHPAVTTKKAVAAFKEQMNMMGFSYDWSREVNSSDPNYYKWTQWFFLLLYKNGLAYKAKGKVNWCPSCQTVLANEQAEGGICERCKSAVVQKDLEQWFFKITDFVENIDKTSGLIDGLDKVDWPESTKQAQRNWIGKSEGAQFKMKIKGSGLSIEVYTTRLDTVFGMTYCVLAPEQPLILELKSQIANWGEVEKYIAQAKKKTDLQRMETKEKTGVKLEGVEAVNPFNNETIPVFMADYVLAHYGTGAVMAVPGHDERDYEFAKKYKLPIKNVVVPYWLDQKNPPQADKETEKREVVCAIIKNPKNNKYLGLRWSITGWQSFPTGGIDGDDLITAALREIKEETGYKNLKFIKQLAGSAYAEFYRPHKGSNVVAHFYYLVFNLENEEKETVEQKEKDRHEAVWIPENEIESFINVENQQFAWKKYKQGDFANCDDGILVGSGEYSGLKSEEAREKMAEWLAKEKIGQKKINYKLRDWLVSRQRYWGTPIPIIYCETCKNKKYNYIILHGRSSTPFDNFYNWLKTQLEKLGHDVYLPDLPKDTLQVEKQVDFVLKNKKIDKNTIIIGHSLGGVVGMRILEKSKTKIARLILVDSFTKPEFIDKKRIDVEKSFYWKLDFKKIKNNANDILILADNKSPVIAEWQAYAMQKFFDARIAFIDSKSKHFQAKIEPEILNAVLSNGIFTVPEKDLPVELPTDVDFMPHGESPLARSKKFQNVKCPKCGAKARRESDTMDTFVCSSWYYFRYSDPKNKKEFAGPELIKKWLPVDLYVGGAEHTVLHLLYARFFTKVLHKLGYINFDEPFLKLRHQGIILAEDSRKMSKSLGNVVNPDELVKQYGADALRMFEMFMGPLEDMKFWNTKGIMGLVRFLEKVWSLTLDKELTDCGGGKVPCKNVPADLPKMLHKTIKKVGEDIENLYFNTAISQMMIFVNFASKFSSLPRPAMEKFLIILSPFAPFLSEELWQRLGHKQSIFKAKWPEYNKDLVKDETINLIIQVNSKIRDTIEVEANISEEEAKKIALKSEKITKWLEGKEVVKVIFVKGKLVNIVIK